VEGRSVMLEEYARQMVYAEELHAGEVDKMLRKPGEISISGLGPKSL
jgi:bacterioferritin